MDYRQQDQIREFANFLLENHHRVDQYLEDPQAKDADLLWDASRFLAQLLYKSSEPSSAFTLEKFKKFKSDYEQLNNIVVDDVKLFERFWLRDVLGFVKIASAISYACLTFEKIILFKEELNFLNYFQSQLPASSISKPVKFKKSQLEAAIKAYEKKNKVSLKKEGIYSKSWLSEKDGEIKLSDIKLYYKYFLDYWDDFVFLNAFRKETYEEEKFLIKVEDFERIQAAYSLMYPATPCIQDFINQKFISSSSNAFYSIQFLNTEPDYWSVLRDKISGYYWELLIQDPSLVDDESRIRVFLKKVLSASRWPDFLQQVTSSSKQRFLNAALKLIITGPDIEGVANEYPKVRLDNRDGRDNLISDNSIDIKRPIFSADNRDLFELLESLNNWEEKAQITQLLGQGARTELAFLIRNIVAGDEEYNSQKEDVEEGSFQTFNFKRIKTLLRAAITKPYLLWQISENITRNRPEVIPYLLVEPEFASVSFALLDSISFNPEHRFQFSLEAWKKATSLMLLSLPEPEQNSNDIATIIFQIYWKLNQGKYDIAFTPNNKADVQFRKELQQRERAVLSLIENAALHNYFTTGSTEEYLLPYVFPDLAKLFTGFEIKSAYRNGTIQFPMLQWDGISWLLKISTYWKYQPQFKPLVADVDKLTKTFLKLYLKTIEIKKVTTYNPFEQKEETSIPLWSEKIERLEYLDWLYPIYLLHKRGDLGKFLSPALEFKKTKDLYHKQNQFTADKLRTHIGVLLQVLRELVLPAIPYGFDKAEITEIKNRIEDKIIDYLKRHSTDVPEEGRVDLFHFNKEWRFQTSDKEALLPQIARALNWFNNKEAVVKAIVQSGDIAKILILLEEVTSEGLKTILLNEIQQTDIRKFLEKYNWIPEVQNVLVKISYYPQLIHQTEEAVQYWEEEILRSRDSREYQAILYRTKLLLAYIRKNEQELEAIEPPGESNVYNTSKLSDLDYKDFYRGLLHITSDYQKSYEIFNDFTTRLPEYPSFALNRMVAKMNWAENEKNSTDLYREAYEEWKDYAANSINEVTSLIDPSDTGILLNLLNNLNEVEEANRIFEQLELPYKMLPRILEQRIDSLIQQKRVDEALFLIESAKTYHHLSSIADIQFIKDLDDKVNGVDNVEVLQVHYLRIFASEPKKLIRIFPEYVNGKTELHAFLAKEIVRSADKMLDKIKAISEIKSEDKYNDIIEVTLDSRINAWGWHVGAQSRGAFSAPKGGGPGKQPGERDLPIMNQNKKVIMLCEAFLYKGKTTAQSHLRKLFNYDHQKSAFTVLIYDTGKMGNNFQKNWSDYISKIVPKAKYPAGYESQGPVEDVTNDFDCSQSAIRVGISRHGTATILYHIFVNINYSVTT